MAKRSNAVPAIRAEEEWKIESDLRCLIEAEQIKKDPKRLAKAQALAKQRVVEAAGVAADAGKP